MKLTSFTPDFVRMLVDLRHAAAGMERAWRTLHEQDATLLQALVLREIVREPGIRPFLLRQRFGYEERRNRPIQQVQLRLVRARLIRAARTDNCTRLAPTPAGIEAAARFETSLRHIAETFWLDLAPEAAAAAAQALEQARERSP